MSLKNCGMSLKNCGFADFKFSCSLTTFAYLLYKITSSVGSMSSQPSGGDFLLRLILGIFLSLKRHHVSQNQLISSFYRKVPTLRSINHRNGAEEVLKRFYPPTAAPCCGVSTFIRFSAASNCSFCRSSSRFVR
jgi:hypothetical protein